MKPVKEPFIAELDSEVAQVYVEWSSGKYKKEYFDKNGNHQIKTGTVPFAKNTEEEGYIERTVIDWRDGRHKEKYFDKKGRLHRDAGPAAIIKSAGKECTIRFLHGKLDAKWGHVVEIRKKGGWSSKKWYENGKLDDTAGPHDMYFAALEEWDEKYSLRRVVHFSDGKRNRPCDLPTEIGFATNTGVTRRYDGERYTSWRYDPRTEPVLNQKRLRYLKWHKDNILQRGGDRPTVLMFDENGHEIRAEWHIDGVLSRKHDRPAVIVRDSNGVVRMRAWYQDGVLSREGGQPAIVEYDENGNVSFCTWFVNGKLGRENGLPTIIEYDKDGIVRSETWCEDGVPHRQGDLPAIVEYDKNGTIIREIWCSHGRVNRIGAPADIEYDKNGKPKVEHWYVDGKPVPPSRKYCPVKIEALRRASLQSAPVMAMC